VFPCVNFYMLLQSGVVIRWSKTQLVPFINNVMFRKSGRMRGVRHAAQIEGGGTIQISPCLESPTERVSLGEPRIDGRISY
jgi:hypothetical protein